MPKAKLNADMFQVMFDAYMRKHRGIELDLDTMLDWGKACGWFSDADERAWGRKGLRAAAAGSLRRAHVYCKAAGHTRRKYGQVGQETEKDSQGRAVQKTFWANLIDAKDHQKRHHLEIIKANASAVLVRAMREEHAYNVTRDKRKPKYQMHFDFDELRERLPEPEPTE